MDKTKAVRAEVVRRLLAVSAVFLLGAGAAHACSANLTQAQVDQANHLLDQNRSKDAFALMYPLSKQGSGGANRFLSEMYEKGRGVKQSSFMKRHLNWMGAQDSDPAAMYRTAVDFFERGHRKDGEYWAKRAIECGSSEALVMLAERYIDGGRIEEARPLIENGLDKSIPRIKFIVAEQYEKGGMGLEINPHLAYTWYYLAAKDGVAEAMTAIGYFFAQGIHGVQDDVAAVEWYHRASQAGDIKAITAYAWMVENGKGTQPDPENARRLYAVAASKGDMNAAAFMSKLAKSK
jgi:TPR repeat protein